MVSACNLLGLSRQVYYRALRKRARNQRTAQKVIALVNDVRRVMRRIGTRKLYHKLEKQLSELNVGRDKLFKILRVNHMLIKPKRSYHITTDSHHRFRKHKNIVCSVEINRPEQIWVSDITYIGTRKNPSYLALITDAYSKKIVGYNVSQSLAVEGSFQALEMALNERNYKDSPLIHHSDRGLKYCSNEYQALLDKNSIKPSMTEKYDLYENAIAERINGILKQEFFINKNIQNIELKNILVKESIEIYNSFRPHCSNHMLTPNQMHKQNQLRRKTYKSKKSHEGQYLINCVSFKK
ncbi:transposase [Nonlabens xylanidelens]|nr:IS3 family transposase [Nonlabens xylanidelens]PQJ20951.1 transposase [Nonlabens xylanidelens]